MQESAMNNLKYEEALPPLCLKRVSFRTTQQDVSCPLVWDVFTVSDSGEKISSTALQNEIVVASYLACDDT